MYLPDAIIEDGHSLEPLMLQKKTLDVINTLALD